MESIEELTQDCEELQRLLKVASRSNVRQLIAAEITALQGRIHKLEEEHSIDPNSGTKKKDLPSKEAEQKPEATHVFTQKIQSYGWDQSDKAVKIYISLKGVENLPKENIKLDLTNESLNLMVMNLDKKNHQFNIKRLLEPIDPQASNFKAKSGNIIVTLKKTVAKNWTHLTKTEKSESDTKTPKMDKEEDPSASIMKMMKQMYDDGDDEMKRTIAKAWTESRDKQASGQLGI